ncbi:hypothetical protein EC991_001078 [Linnemannia zychae]|nr:hypothetical protein EC991_001078 [Linnemannia zychae]
MSIDSPAVVIGICVASIAGLLLLYLFYTLYVTVKGSSSTTELTTYHSDKPSNVKAHTTINMSASVTFKSKTTTSKHSSRKYKSSYYVGGFDGSGGGDYDGHSGGGGDGGCSGGGDSGGCSGGGD